MTGDIRSSGYVAKGEKSSRKMAVSNAERILHNGRVYVRPLKHFASRRLRQTIRSAQTGHQLLLGRRGDSGARPVKEDKNKNRFLP
jgi:hypothetical protein